MLRIHHVLLAAMFFMTCCLCPRTEVRFSPEGGSDAMVLCEIAKADKSIEVAMYAFTSKPIAGALVNAQGQGVSVRVILDGNQARSKYSVYPYLLENGIPVAVEKGSGLMHHKFMVINGVVVITGGYNFTQNAEQRNYENLVVIRDRGIAELYLKEFEEMWNNFACTNISSTVVLIGGPEAQEAQ